MEVFSCFELSALEDCQASEALLVVEL